MFSLAMMMAGGGAGCLSNNLGSASTNAITTSSTRSTSGGSGSLPTGNASGGEVFTLSKVVRSNQDPTGKIELITEEGEIGIHCPELTSCKCKFNWVEANGVLRDVDQAPEYIETNMMRCLFTQVNPTVTQFDVRVLIQESSLFSTRFTVRMTLPNPSLDPTIGSNYVSVQRYMCRDMPTIRDNTSLYLQGTAPLMDPRLWTMTQGYNLYTTSFGQDYGATPTTSGSTTVNPTGYECPMIPNDKNFDKNLTLTLKSIAPVDLSNPTRIVPVGDAGDDTIFPSDDNLNIATCVTGSEASCEKFRLNRHDFYLARFQDNVFKHPVCVIHKVGNLATGVLECSVDASKGTVVLGSQALAAGGRDIIGFGAVPDGNQNCPDTNTVRIPSGKKWAKVWRFRKSLDARRIFDVANPDHIGDLFCATRNKECIGVGAGSSACAGVSNPSGPTLGTHQSAQISSITGSLGWGNCDDRKPSADGGSCISGDFKCCRDDLGDPDVAGVPPAAYNVKGNWCNPGLKGFDSSASGTDVWLIGNQGRFACIEADTDTDGKLKTGFWSDTTGDTKVSAYVMSSRPLESDTQRPKADVVYVVTPKEITIQDMQDQTTRGQQFVPYRCINDDCSTPTNKISYGLLLGSENSATNSERLSKFPLCVLQDDK